MAVLKRSVLPLVVGVGVLLVPMGRTHAAGPAPDDGPSAYSYYYQGQRITLEASGDLIALVEGSPGSADALAATQGWRRDPTSDRPALKSRGLALYRLRRAAGKSTTALASPPALDVAARAGLVAQPVFELGGALKIPFDEVTIAFHRDTTLKDAQAFLDGQGSDQGVVGIRLLMKNTFILTISDAGHGRAFSVSRALASLPGVAYAEPNCVVFLFDEPARPFADAPPRPMPAVEGHTVPLEAAGPLAAGEPPPRRASRGGTCRSRTSAGRRS